MNGRRVAVSTQEKNPRSASVRTGLAALIGMLLLLNPILGVVIEVLRPYDAVVPGWVFLWLNGAITVTAVGIALVTRIMAIPGVNDWLRTYAKWLAPEDKQATPADPGLTEDYHLATRDDA